MTVIKPSRKQKKMIKLIEDCLGIKFKGKSMFDAIDFIKDNSIDNIDVRDYKKPSEKQLRGIQLVNSVLKESFNPKNMKEASDILEQYYDKVISILNNKKGSNRNGR